MRERRRLGCPGAREEGAGWGRGEGRRTEHAPEDAAAGTCRRRLCGSRHSTSDFSSDQERSVEAGPPRQAPSPVSGAQPEEAGVRWLERPGLLCNL